MKIAQHIFIAVFLTVLMLPFGVQAIVPSEPIKQQDNQKSQLEKPEGPGTSKDNPFITCGTQKDGSEQNPCDVDDFNALIQNALRLVFIFGGFIVAGMFMYAGFMLITSVGDMGKIQRAKDIFRRVVIGFIIMSLSYLIIENLLTNIQAQEFFRNIFK